MQPTPPATLRSASHRGFGLGGSRCTPVILIAILRHFRLKLAQIHIVQDVRADRHHGAGDLRKFQLIEPVIAQGGGEAMNLPIDPDHFLGVTRGERYGFAEGFKTLQRSWFSYVKFNSAMICLWCL